MHHQDTKSLVVRIQPSACELVAMILFGMENAKHNHAVGHDGVEDFVWEASGEQATEAAIVVRSAFGMALEAPDEGGQFAQELITPTGLLALVALPRTAQVRFRAWTDDDAPRHWRRPCRMRASTSSQVEPASGARANSSNSASRIRFSSSMTEGSTQSSPSSSRALATISPRCSRVRRGSSWRISVLLIATDSARLTGSSQAPVALRACGWIPSLRACLENGVAALLRSADSLIDFEIRRLTQTPLHQQRKHALKGDTV